MKNQDVETWDEGRLQINPQFAPLLREHQLTNFDAFLRLQPVSVAKDLLRERQTFRVELGAGPSKIAFYLKRHTPPPFKEYVKPLLRLRLPILGAKNEWQALLAFHAAHLPTMNPVAYGKSGRISFLLTEALEDCQRLSEVFTELDHHTSHKGAKRRQELTRSVARLTRRMHDCGWHHQDYYAGHLLLRKSDDQLFVIDLGRARPLRLFRRMFIFKDLAQLAYSLHRSLLSDRFRFLRSYWGRPFRRAERRWLRRIRRKLFAIARHDRNIQDRFV